MKGVILMKKIFYAIPLVIIILVSFRCSKDKDKKIEQASSIEESTTVHTEEYKHTPKFVVHDEEPIPIKQVPPNYPATAKESGLEGVVVLKVEVLKNGSVGDVVVVKSLQSGQDGLDELAIKAVKQWEFIPAKNKGNPVSVWITIPIRFKQDKQEIKM